MYIQYLLCALREVWSMLWEIPAPYLVVAEERLRPKVLMYYILVMFPLLGCLVWAGLSVLGSAAAMLQGRIAAAMLFAILATFFLEILGGGKGLSSTSSFIEKLLCKESLLRSMFTAENNIHVERSPIGLLCMFMILMLRGFCLGALYSSGYGSWFGLVFILSYAMQAQLATIPLLSSGIPIIKTDVKGIRVLWTAAIILALIIGRGYLLYSVAGIAIAAVISWATCAFFSHKANGTTGALIGSCGYLLETFLLITGAGLLLQ